MAESSSGAGNGEFAAALAVPHRRGRLALVWMVPIVAALVGLWIATNAVLQRGPVITITFLTANGIEAGKTQIRYKDVVIGEVTGVTLAEDRSRVIVTARMTREAKSLLNDDTAFWVVTVRITNSSVSGLGTLLSGAYIGVAPGRSETMREEFTGLQAAPVVSGEAPGRYYALHAAALGSLNVGSPVYFRQVSVGEVTAFEIDKEGRGVTINVLVSEPFHRFVTTRTRFWNASGIDLSLGADGLSVQMPSVVSLLIGGIVFDSADPPAAGEEMPVAEVAAAGASFRLFADRRQALRPPDGHSELYTFVFRESVRGLAVGAPVELRGINIGEVTAITMDYQPATGRFDIPVAVRVYPERLRSRVRQYDPKFVARAPGMILRELIEGGLRAQLRSGNLLTGQLYVALDYFPAAPRVKVDWNRQPIVLPTMPGEVAELSAQVKRILAKLEHLPLEAISSDVRKTLRGAEKTLAGVDRLMQRVDGEVGEIGPQAQAALIELRALLNSDSPLQLEARSALRETGSAARALRVLADYLERHPDSLLRGKPASPSPAEPAKPGRDEEP